MRTKSEIIENYWRTLRHSHQPSSCGSWLHASQTAQQNESQCRFNRVLVFKKSDVQSEGFDETNKTLLEHLKNVEYCGETVVYSEFPLHKSSLALFAHSASLIPWLSRQRTSENESSLLF